MTINKISKIGSSLVTLAELQSGSAVFVTKTSRVSTAGPVITGGLVSRADIIKRGYQIQNIIARVLINPTGSIFDFLERLALTDEITLLLFGNVILADQFFVAHSAPKFLIGKGFNEVEVLQENINLRIAAFRVFEEAQRLQSAPALTLTKPVIDDQHLLDATRINAGYRRAEADLQDILDARALFTIGRNIKNTITIRDALTKDLTLPKAERVDQPDAKYLQAGKALFDGVSIRNHDDPGPALFVTKLLRDVTTMQDLTGVFDGLTYQNIMYRFETLGLNDRFAKVLQANRIFEEDIAASDKKYLLRGFSYQDAVTADDGKNLLINKQPRDAASVADVLRRVFLAQRIFEDAPLIAEIKRFVASLRKTEAVDIAQALSAAVFKSRTDRLSAADARINKTLIKSRIDGILSSDAVTRLMRKLLIDAQVMVDAAFLMLVTHRAIRDVVALIDNEANLDVVKTINKAIVVADRSRLNITLPRIDVIEATEATRSLLLNKLVADTVPMLDLTGVFDGLTYQNIMYRFEALGIDDRLSLTTVVFRNFADIAAVSDVFAKARGIGFADRTDSFALTDKLIIGKLPADTIYIGSGLNQRNVDSERTTFNIGLNIKTGYRNLIRNINLFIGYEEYLTTITAGQDFAGSIIFANTSAGAFVQVTSIGTGTGFDGGFVTPLGTNYVSFKGAGSRSLTTVPLDLSSVTSVNITFSVIAGNNNNGGEQPDLNEDLVIEYSTDDGANFVTAAMVYAIQTYAYSTWFEFSTSLPVAAQTTATLLRWRQTNQSLGYGDNYGLNDFRIGTTSFGTLINTYSDNNTATIADRLVRGQFKNPQDFLTNNSDRTNFGYGIAAKQGVARTFDGVTVGSFDRERIFLGNASYPIATPIITGTTSTLVSSYTLTHFGNFTEYSEEAQIIPYNSTAWWGVYYPYPPPDNAVYRFSTEPDMLLNAAVNPQGYTANADLVTFADNWTLWFAIGRISTITSIATINGYAQFSIWMKLAPPLTSANILIASDLSGYYSTHTITSDWTRVTHINPVGNFWASSTQGSYSVTPYGNINVRMIFGEGPDYIKTLNGGTEFQYNVGSVLTTGTGVYVWGRQVTISSDYVPAPYIRTTDTLILAGTNDITDYATSNTTSTSFGVYTFTGTSTTVVTSYSVLLPGNMLRSSEELVGGTSNWNQSYTNGVSNVILAPDGTVTGDKFWTGMNADGYVVQTTGPNTDITLPYTFSVWLRGDGSSVGSQVSLIITRYTTSVSKVVTLTDNWVRESVTSPSGEDVREIIRVQIYTVGFAKRQAFYAWGAQYNTGSTVLTYTRTTSLSRLASTVTSTYTEYLYTPVYEWLSAGRETYGNFEKIRLGEAKGLQESVPASDLFRRVSGVVRRFNETPTTIIDRNYKDITLTVYRGTSGSVRLKTIDSFDSTLSSVAVSYGARSPDVVGTIDFFSTFTAVGRDLRDAMTLGSQQDQRQRAEERISLVITKRISDSFIPEDYLQTFDGLTYAATLLERDTISIGLPGFTGLRVSGTALERTILDFSLTAYAGVAGSVRIKTIDAGLVVTSALLTFGARSPDVVGAADIIRISAGGFARPIDFISIGAEFGTRNVNNLERTSFLINKRARQDTEVSTAISNGSFKFVNAFPVGQYLSTTVTAAGSDSVTYEWYFYHTSNTPVTQGMLQTRTGTGGADGIDVSIESGKITISSGSTFYLRTAGNTLALNTWYHIAVVRSGTTSWTTYVDGSSIGTFSLGSLTGVELKLGLKSATTFNEFFDGNISNFRYVKGTAVYTDTFTRPAGPLTAIAGTQLLLNTLNDATFLTDESTNNCVIVNNNNVTVSPLNPFFATNTDDLNTHPVQIGYGLSAPGKRISGLDLERTNFDVALIAYRSVAGTVTLNTIDPNPDVEYQQSSVTVVRGARSRDEVGMLDYFNLTYAITKTLPESVLSSDRSRLTVGKNFGDETVPDDFLSTFDGLTYRSTMLEREVQSVGLPLGIRVSGSDVERVVFDGTKLMKQGVNRTFSSITVTAASGERLFVGQVYGSGRFGGDPQEKIALDVSKIVDVDPIINTLITSDRPRLRPNIRADGADQAFVVLGSGAGDRWLDLERVTFNIIKGPRDIPRIGNSVAGVRRSGDALEALQFDITMVAKQGVIRTFSGITVTAGNLGERVFVGQQYTGVYRANDGQERVSLGMGKTADALAPQFVSVGRSEDDGELRRIGAETIKFGFGRVLADRPEVTEDPNFNITMIAYRGVVGAVTLNTIDGAPNQQSSVTIGRGTRSRDEVGMLNVIALASVTQRTTSDNVSIGGSTDRRQNLLERTFFTIGKNFGDETIPDDFLVTNDGLTYRSTMLERETLSIGLNTAPKVSGSDLESTPFFIDMPMRRGVAGSVVLKTIDRPGSRQLSSVTVNYTARGPDVVGTVDFIVLDRIKSFAEFISIGSGQDQRQRAEERISLVITKRQLNEDGTRDAAIIDELKSLNLSIRAKQANYAAYTVGTATRYFGAPEIVRGNLIKYSEDLTQYTTAVNWISSNVIVTGNATASPTGTPAVKISDNAVLAVHFMRPVFGPAAQVTVVSGTTVTISLYGKAAERNIIEIQLSNQVNSVVYASFNLSSGAVIATGFLDINPDVGDWTSITTSIDAAGNGWYRCSITATKTNVGLTASTFSCAPRIATHNGTTSNYTGDGVSGLYMWGVQGEYVSAVGPYLPTTSTQIIIASNLAGGRDFVLVGDPHIGGVVRSAKNQFENLSIDFNKGIADAGITTDRFRTTSIFIRGAAFTQEDQSIAGQYEGNFRYALTQSARIDGLLTSDFALVQLVIPKSYADLSGDLDPFGNINTMVGQGTLRMTNYVDIDYLTENYVGESRSFT